MKPVKQRVLTKRQRRMLQRKINDAKGADPTRIKCLATHHRTNADIIARREAYRP